MYQRVILKLSGEALKGHGVYGIDPQTVKGIALEIKKMRDLGVEVAVVVGAGNLWRGKTGEELGMDRAQADYMGMLGTIMNSLALQDALEGHNVATRVMSALPTSAVAEPYIRRRALRHLEKGRIVIFACGTGSPYFTTDSAAALRAIEMEADVILLAKNIDGVYNKDPKKYDDAKKYDSVTYMQAISEKLGVMDTTAITLCMENKIPICVFALNEENSIIRAVSGEKIGTIIEE